MTIFGICPFFLGGLVKVNNPLLCALCIILVRQFAEKLNKMGDNGEPSLLIDEVFISEKEKHIIMPMEAWS